MAADYTSSGPGVSRKSDCHGDYWDRSAWLEAKNEIEETDRDIRYDNPLQAGQDLNMVDIAGYSYPLHCQAHAFATCNACSDFVKILFML